MNNHFESFDSLRRAIQAAQPDEYGSGYAFTDACARLKEGRATVPLSDIASLYEQAAYKITELTREINRLKELI